MSQCLLYFLFLVLDKFADPFCLSIKVALLSHAVYVKQLVACDGTERITDFSLYIYIYISAQDYMFAYFFSVCVSLAVVCVCVCV